MSPRLTRLFWKCHSACALYAGGFLAFILATGAFAVFAEPLARWEAGSLTRVAGAPFDPTVLPAAVERASARLAEAGGEPYLLSVRLPQKTGETIQASFYNLAQPENPFAFQQPWASQSVFLHPSSGDILGFFRDDRSLSNYLRTLHVRLFAGTPGRNFVGLFGLALVFLCLSGLLILGRFLGRKALWVIRRRPPRARQADIHKLAGVVLLLPLLLFAVTGFWLGMQGRLMQWFAMERPERFDRTPVMEAAEDAAHPIDLPAVLARTRSVHPQLVPQQISWSNDGTRTVRVRGRLPGTLYERLSQGVVLDKTSLDVLKVVDTSRGPWTEKLFYLQEGLHFGDFAGLSVQVIYFLVGLLTAVLPLTGYAIHRLRTRRSLAPFWAWIAFAGAYSLLMLALVQGQGVVFAMAYGTVVLWIFVAALLLFWLQRSVRRRFAPRVRA